MRTPSKSLYTVFFLLALCVAATAADINWNSTIGADSYKSGDLDDRIGAGFVFELGAFADDFTPTGSNTGEWADHWVALDRASYNPVTRFFSSKANLASNAVPFHWSQRGYIWGFDQGNPGEWILVTNSDWTWPFAAGVQPPVTWSIGASGTTAIVGEVNGSGFQMKTASVAQNPPDVNPTAWMQQHFSATERANPAISDWDSDPDNDGANNLFELAAGTSPKSAISFPQPEVVLVDLGSGSVDLQLRLPRAHRAAINYSAESSTDLFGWSTAGLQVTADNLGQLVIQFPMNSERLFGRFTFSLP